MSGSQSSDFLEVFSIVHGDPKLGNYRRNLLNRTPFKTPLAKSRQQYHRYGESLESVVETESSIGPSSTITTSHSVPVSVANEHLDHNQLREHQSNGVHCGGSELEIIDCTPLRQPPPGADLQPVIRMAKYATHTQQTRCYILPQSRKVRHALEHEIGFSKRTLKVSQS